MSREKFCLVQSLRGIAALWVVLFHARAGGHINALLAKLPAAGGAFFDLGETGVAIFFALSGFVIAHSIAGDRITPAYIGRFALRRSIRLDPAYWASIMLFLTFAIVSAAVKREPMALPSSAQLAANLTYTQLFAGLPSINAVYWTLCYEVQFYLVLVCCVMAAQRYGAWPYVLATICAVLFGAGLVENPVPGLFVDRWHCFFLGVLAYWAKEEKLAAYAFTALSVPVLLLNPSPFTIMSMLTALVLMVTHRTGTISQALAWRPLLALGAVSYSLYLTHNPVSGAAFFVLDKIGTPQWLALLLTVAACIATAGAFWWAIERPTAELARKVSLRRARHIQDAAHGAALNPSK